VPHVGASGITPENAPNPNVLCLSLPSQEESAGLFCAARVVRGGEGLSGEIGRGKTTWGVVCLQGEKSNPPKMVENNIKDGALL